MPFLPSELKNPRAVARTPKTPSKGVIQAALVDVYVGIDPGQAGGIAVLNRAGEIVAVTPMPPTETDIADVFADLIERLGGDTTDVFAVIERVHSMPKQGVASSFKFGMGYGGLRMALVCNDIPFEDIPPQSWMKVLSIPSIKNQTKGEQKEKLRAKAQQLFPKADVWKLGKGKQMAVADALLLAEYCRRKRLGII